MSEAVVGRKRGLIIGSKEGIEDELMVQLFMSGMDIHQAEDFGSVARLLESNCYNFVLYLDEPGTHSGPDFLRALYPLIPQKKIIVLIQGDNLTKYAEDAPNNIFGFFDVHAPISLLETLIDQVFDIT